MITLNINESPEKPVTGTGLSRAKAGKLDVTLTWADNQIVDITSQSGDLRMMDASLNGMDAQGAITCLRCAIDTDTGAWWCWIVPCTPVVLKP